MSNIIPPLLSNTPPPILDPLDDEEEDEFGDFTSAIELSYNCESLSLPPSPLYSHLDSIPRLVKDENLDENSNTNKKVDDVKVSSYVNDSLFTPIDKDYQDKRKHCDTPIKLEKSSENEVNSTQLPVNNVNSSAFHNSDFEQFSTPGNTKMNVLPNDKYSVPIEKVPAATISDMYIPHITGNDADTKLNKERKVIQKILPDGNDGTNSVEDNSIVQEAADVGNVPFFTHKENEVNRISKLGETVKNDKKSDCSCTLSDDKSSCTSEFVDKSHTVSRPQTNGTRILDNDFHLTEEPPDFIVKDDDGDGEFGDFKNCLNSVGDMKNEFNCSAGDANKISPPEIISKNEFCCDTVENINKTLPSKTVTNNELSFSTAEGVKKILPSEISAKNKISCSVAEGINEILRLDSPAEKGHNLTPNLCLEYREEGENKDISAQNAGDYNKLQSPVHANNSESVNNLSEEPPELNSVDDLFDEFNYYSCNTYNTDDDPYVKCDFKAEDCQNSYVAESEPKISKISFTASSSKGLNFNQEIRNNTVTSEESQVNKCEVENFEDLKNSPHDISQSTNLEIHNLTNNGSDILETRQCLSDVKEEFAHFPDTSPTSNADSNTENDDTFGNFGLRNECKTPCAAQQPQESDEFDDFHDFQGQDEIEARVCEKKVSDDDEFGDFDDYNHNQETGFASFESPATLTLALSYDSKSVLKKAEEIISIMFPLCQECHNEAMSLNFMQNSVFKEIKDITETTALTYQWTKSTSQNNLLNALNVDTRNILYGSGWNSSMPKFAANLSFAPLEPVKSDVLHSTLVSSADLNPSLSSHNPVHPTTLSMQPEIPTAQFDWSDSGLTNPLDYTQASTMLLDLEQLVGSLDLTNTYPVISQTPAPSDHFDEWENWLKSLPKENQEKPSPSTRSYQENFNTMQNSTELNFHLPQTSTNTLEHLPARQQADNESVNSLQLTSDSYQEHEEMKQKCDNPEDDFEDFTSYQPQKTIDTSNLSRSIRLRESYISNQNTYGGSKGQDESSEPGWLKPTILTPDLSRKIQEDSDDNFTDFQMSLPTSGQVQNNISTKDFSEARPQITPNILRPVPILEPLKLTVMQPQVGTEVTQINWPHPGITEEDIRNIELTYSSKRPSSERGFKESLQSKQVGNNTLKTSESKVVEQDNFIKDVKGKPLNDQSKPLSTQLLPHNVPSSQNLDSLNFEFARNSLVIRGSPGAGIEFTNNSMVKKESTAAKPRSICNSVTYIQANVENAVSAIVNKVNDDNEEWSEFVCNPEPVRPSSHPAKMHFANLNQLARSSTPELQLSVPQLSCLQPPKLPIPVITPHGLIQTKIPSNIPIINPTFQPSVPHNIHRAQSNIGFQPSIISNQYQNHMNGPSFNRPVLQLAYNNPAGGASNFTHLENGFNPNLGSNSSPNVGTHFSPKFSQTNQNLSKLQLEKPSTLVNTAVKNDDDDDDWTDFISTPPVQQNKPQNGVRNTQQMQYGSARSFDWNRGPHFNSWNSTGTPNIITNPVHFDSMPSYLVQGNDVLNSKANKKFTNVSLQSKLSTVPSISALPDLDFIAPKSRTFTKK